MFYTQDMIGRRGFLKVLCTAPVAGVFAGRLAQAQFLGGWYPSQLIQPRALVARLAEKGRSRPLVLQVGSDMQYRSKHIPGAIYAGPGFRQDGLDRLRATVEHLPRTREIYIYCGCCPFEECPNVRPAYDLLTQMGFINVKVLELATNFDKDWVLPGYPVVGG